ncbi:hypothetical protein RF11_02227 [Thelohanellus kitauei]|uniref:Uncharacterized protein n=1 Tax=Thelohanellus kitauei TaxID=669202 RepID=A0A0C2IDL5_THEKT|nr:hypothetical protein RF11_02227 [Thelohanellus kitauei]
MGGGGGIPFIISKFIHEDFPIHRACFYNFLEQDRTILMNWMEGSTSHLSVGAALIPHFIYFCISCTMILTCLCNKSAYTCSDPIVFSKLSDVKLSGVNPPLFW